VKPSQRLAGLGVALPDVAAPIGAYVPALAYGTTVRTSGQLPLEGGVLLAVGTVGEGPGLVSPEAAAACARVAALNALAALAQVAGGIDAIARIVRVVGYVASAPGFTGQAGVLNGASALMTDVFGEAGRHVRSGVGVASLPLGAPVEVEVEALLG
jgi:enamine deaminase RidA (YjgF/YER057c/UK114 family)